MATLRKRAQNQSAFDYDDYDDEPSASDRAAYALLGIMPLVGDVARFAGRYGGKVALGVAAVAILVLGTDLVGGA